MPLRIKDIAAELQLSPATVSLVMNNKPGVGETTRQRVLQFAAENGYTPNLLSKPALKNNRNIRFVIYKKHGKVVSDTPFFSALMEGIEQEARDQGYNVLVSYLTEVGNIKMEVVRILEERAPEGVLLLATEMTEGDLGPFQQLALPLVVLDSCFVTAKQDAVLINNYQGAYAAVKYLLDFGHTEIGYLHSSVWINNFDERQAGLEKALADRRLELDQRFRWAVEPTLEGAYADVCRRLKTGEKLPSAFFADNDIIAFGAIKAFKENGINLPDQVSLIGFDDMPFCEMCDPPLTTLCVYKQRMGRLAIRRLIERIESQPEESVKIEINTEIVVRKSVARIKDDF